MKQDNLITKSSGFWSSLGPIAKRGVALILRFFGIPVAIVVN